MWSSATSASCTARETASMYSPDLPRASEMLTKGMRKSFPGRFRSSWPSLQAECPGNIYYVGQHTWYK
jgi:hypothetical protein